MASIRKRTWTTNGETKTAWVADYFDQAGIRRLKRFHAKKLATTFLSTGRDESKRAGRLRRAQAIQNAKATGRSGTKEAVAVLYRHFNDDGVLLYVGVSKKGLSRLAQHQSSPWFREIAMTTFEHFVAYEWALAAERDAIEKEDPLYNVSAGTRVNARARIKKLADKAA
jgi:hypothetical protein